MALSCTVCLRTDGIIGERTVSLSLSPNVGTSGCTVCGGVR
jgi:hypothetical protein